ncbi:MAG: sigma-70 family RNA polymerase sigma factor [Lentisphaerales bacterium]|nr:sigma-70 family RNA polymerase sigma factor [Lentisphaerales bacterium]
MTDDWNTRQTLLMRVKNQDDEHAWGEFVSYYQSFIEVILKHLKVSPNDQDDLTQNILLKVWKSLEKLNYDSERARFRTWMNRVIRNAVIDFQRAKSRRISEVDSDTGIDTKNFPLQENEFTKIIDKEWRAHITNLALKNIRPNFSGNAMSVFDMFLDEVPAKDIAAKLAIAVPSVYKLRSRVEEKLIKEIKRLKLELEF